MKEEEEYDQKIESKKEEQEVKEEERSRLWRI